MDRHGREQGNGGIAQEAARIFCEEHLTDYRAAKQKALVRLNLGPRTSLPDNATVQRAVLEYQRLFGGVDYQRRLYLLREKAILAMELLKDFSPRLAGAVVSGAITRAHAVQVHVFSEPAEAVDIFLQNKGIRYEQDDRQYRYGNDRERMIPRVSFEAADVRVVAAIFPEGELKRAPINPADGQPYARLDRAAARLLLKQTVSV